MKTGSDTLVFRPLPLTFHPFPGAVSMDFLAPISRNLIAPLWAKWERSPYLSHYKDLLKTQYDSPEVIRDRQTGKMRRILEHAYKTSLFWKERFETAGVKPEEIRELEDLRKLPLLTKTDLRTRLEDMISTEYPDREKLTRHKTSGSTGVAVVVYSNEESDQFKRGAVLRSDEWSGWKLGERVASLWTVPKEPFRLRRWLRNTLLDRRYVHLYTLKMDEEAMNAFVDTMIKWEPSLIFGHAHTFYLLVDFLKKRRPEVKIRPKGIIATAMVLYDQERRIVEDYFQCKITNRYGCEEVSLIACECEKHEGLHVNLDALHVELIDFKGEPSPHGEPGRVVVTDLCNEAMPMIRYEIGDTATWSGKPCSCGRMLPLFSRIEGRVADYIVTKNKDYISGISLTTYFACELPELAQIQIIQEEVDRFVFNLVKGDLYSEKTLEKLDFLVKERFGEQTRYEYHFLEKIPQEPSGKFRFCISKVEKTFS